MALKRLSLRGFRNLSPSTIDFDSAINYLFGPNGAGKTNLLEAVHYLGVGRSFRRCADSEILSFGSELLVVEGTDDRGKSAEIRFDGREKRVLLDDHRIERLSDYFGWLPVVTLLLEDIELVRGGPGLRRGFLDMAIAKVDRGYIAILAEYRRALAQRTRLLETGADEEIHDLWESTLTQKGVLVYARRQEVVSSLLPLAAAHLEQLGCPGVEFVYAPSVDCLENRPDAFLQRLRATRQRSLAVKKTLAGPHRDDIRIRRGDRDLRRFGSVGEQRLAGIALRLAEADMLLEKATSSPVFLLDEVASELDEQRSSQVLRLVGERGQIVYAAARKLTVGDGASAARDAASDAAHERFPRGKEFHVEAGRVCALPG